MEGDADGGCTGGGDHREDGREAGERKGERNMVVALLARGRGSERRLLKENEALRDLYGDSEERKGGFGGESLGLSN